MKQIIFILFILVTCALCLSDCISSNIKIDKIGHYPKPIIEALPLSVGVYYGNEFSTQIYEIEGRTGVYEHFNVQIGQASIALFNYIFSNVFQKVTSIQNLSDGTDNINDIDLIIEPTVYSYLNSQPSNSQVFLLIQITYEIKFFTPDGEQIGSWHIGGSGVKSSPRLELEDTVIMRLTQIAMREVALKFITDFCNQYEIKKFFNNQCNQ
jgi:hypothetical protein